MEATATLPKDQQFAWTVPGWPIAAQMLGPKQDPARKARIEQVLRNGLLVMHALPFTAHTESLELEDLVRGLDFSRAIARKYGLPLPLAAKMTDVPSHSWVLPTLLSHAGVRFLHLGCNPASQTPRVPALFWWEGPDGSRILCGYTADYGSGLKPPKGWPSVNYLAMMMTGDNHGPPSATDVEKWRETCAKTMPDVNVHFGTLDDFAKAVIAENPKLMVVRGDMPDTWIHGLMSMPQATRVARNMRPLAPALEILDTQLRLWGLSPVPATKTLAKVYENSLLFAEHTWGMSAGFGPRELYGAAWKKWLADMEQEPLPANGDYSKLPRGSKRKWMQSYQDHRDYANTADKLVRDGLQESLALLADNVTAKPGDNVVYNPLPWTRSGIVEMGEKTFFARDVPACGYKVFPATAASTASAVSPAASSASSLETPHFKVEWDLKRGGIASLIEKATGREWVDKSSAYVIGQFLHERYDTRQMLEFHNAYGRPGYSWPKGDLPNGTPKPLRFLNV
ncbi:MAG: hypothetical protein WCH61_11190, partial [bacterium]